MTHIQLDDFYENLRKRNEREWGNRRFEIAHHLGIQSHANFSDLLAELLQNAEDANARRFGLQILPEGLLVWNDGQPFEKKDVGAISGLLASSKEEDAIGYFGIGFKAVLLITRTPCILSGEYRFWLQEGIDPYPLEPSVALEGAPRPPQVPEWAWQLARQYNTVFWLPWREDEIGERFRQQMEGQSRSLAFFLLFLNRLEAIEVNTVACWNVRRKKLSEEPPEPTELILSGPDGETRYIRFSWTATPSQDVVQKVVEALYEHDPRRARWQKAPPPSLFGLAVALDSEGRPRPETGKVFVYLPTSEVTGFRFHLQGRMALTGDRKRLKFDDPMTRWALEELRDKVQQWPEWFDSVGLFPSVWRVLPRPQDAQKQWQGVAEVLCETLKEGPFFYGDDDRPYTKDQVFLAHREELYDLITTDDLEEITSREGARWVHPEMRSREAREVVHSLGVQEVKADAIISWLARQTDPAWWEGKPLSWLQKLYRYLDVAKVPTQELKQIPLVRVRNGNHVLPAKAVFPPEAEDEVPEDLQEYLNTMPIVHQELAAEFRGLLSRLGTRDFHIENLIDRFLKSQYSDNRRPTPAENVHHIRLLFTLFEKGDISRRKLQDWSCLPILRDIRANWVRPRDAYLPPELGGIAELQSYLKLAGERSLVMPDYQQEGDNPEAWRNFLEALGCAWIPRMVIREQPLPTVEQRREWCLEHEISSRYLYFEDGKEEWRWKGLDWEIDGFEAILNQLEDRSLSIKETRALWVVGFHISQKSHQQYQVSWPEIGKRWIIDLRPTQSCAVWFYYDYNKSYGIALWVKRLKHLAWLPDEQGRLRRPGDLFAPELKELLGEEGFSYLHPDIPLKSHREWAKILGVRLEASLEEVCNALESRLEQEPEPTTIEPVYKWLKNQVEKRASSVDRDKIVKRLREIFAERPLIFVPNQGVFKRTAVCWRDPSDVMPSLQKAWPDFYNFFVRILGVPEEPDVTHVARFLVESLRSRRDPNDWHEAARNIQHRWDELDKSLQDELRALKWPGVRNGEHVWNSPERLLLPDNRRLKRLFEEGDARFAWWTLKDLEQLAQKLGVRPVSEAEPEVSWKGDLGPWDEIQHKLAHLWGTVRWFSSAYGKEVPEGPPDVRKANKIEVVYRLGRMCSAVKCMDAMIDCTDGKYVLWVASTIQPRDVCHAIGTALKEHFGVEHLREFLKEIWDVGSADDWHHLLERWAEEVDATEWPAFPDAVVTEAKDALFDVEESVPGQLESIKGVAEKSRVAVFSREAVEPMEDADAQKRATQKHERRPGRDFVAQVVSTHPGYARSRSGGYPRENAEAKRQIEKAAMMAAQTWLEREGFQVTDVSSEMLGYDLKATRESEVRYVEVKGLSQRGPVGVTENEWRTAQELGDAYWLFVYVVEEDTAWTLSNPARTLGAEPRHRWEVIYIVYNVWEIAKQVGVDFSGSRTAQNT